MVNYYQLRVKQLQEEREKLALWAQVFNTPLGQKALSELKRRQEAARDLYRHIPPTHPEALKLLIDAQHAEKYHRELIQAVEDAKQREKDIDAEIEKMVEQDNRSQRSRREPITYTGEEDGS